MYLYHATFRANLASIRKYGLGAKQPKNWDISKDGVVYFANNPDSAFSFCECAEDVSDSKYYSGIIVFGVNIGPEYKGRLLKDANSREIGSGNFCIKGIIPPNKLEVIVNRQGERRNIGKLVNIKRVPAYE